MKTAGQLVARTLDYLKKKVKPGITTKELDIASREFLAECGAKAAFFGYRGYPGYVCVSVNDEIVHGIPGGRVLLEGDIVSLDFGVEHQGYFGDAAITVLVGKISEQAQNLIKVTEEALWKAIAVARKGVYLSDISFAVQHIPARFIPLAPSFFANSISSGS